MSQIALITGATRGVGKATAELLADQGYQVYASGRSEIEFDHPNIQFCPLDVTNSEEIQSAIGAIVEKERRIDVLINNTSYGLLGAVESLTIEEIHHMMEVNFYGSLRMCHAVLPHMRKQKSGRIVNLSSVNAAVTVPYNSAYCASKSALESAMEALSVELAPWNIQVTMIEPGWIQTHFTMKMGSRPLHDAPYQEQHTTIEKFNAARMENPQALSKSQSAEEIATFISEVLSSPKMALRYQTSAHAKEIVARKFAEANTPF